MKATTPSCFVIGPIGESGSTIRRKADWVLHGLIKPVLEDPAFGYVVKRADQDPNPGSISDAMINDIFDADLVVADLTGFNPNAFYKLGIRHAFQKPAIHIIAERGTKPPFDNQDQRTIEVDFDDFHHVEEAKRLMVAAVKYVQQSGFKVSNPVTRARGFAELIASGDPKDIFIAKVQSELEMVSGRLRRLEAPLKMRGRNTNLFSSSTDTMIERVGEYYNYIREAVGKNLRVPFSGEVVDIAMFCDEKSQFVKWYLDYFNNNSGTDWLLRLEILDEESFKELEKNDKLIKLLSPSQLSKFMIEMERRANSSHSAG